MVSYNSRCHTHKSLKSNLVQWPAAAISTCRRINLYYITLHLASFDDYGTIWATTFWLAYLMQIRFMLH